MIKLYYYLGVFGEWYADKFIQPSHYSNISKVIDDEYKSEHGKNVSDYIKEVLLKNVGVPIEKMIKYDFLAPQ